MQIKGTVTHLLPVQSGQGKNGNEWKKDGFVIQTDDQYPKNVAVTRWGDLCNVNLIEGQRLTVHINIESREYNGRWFTDVKAWKLDLDGGTTEQPQGEAFGDDNGVDDLPF